MVDLLDSFIGVCEYAIQIEELHPSANASDSAETTKTISIPQAFTVSQMKFYLKKTGSPTGTIKAGIWTDNGSNKPSQTAADESSTTSLSMATISGVRYTQYTFNFNGVTTFPAGVYHVGVYAATKTTLDGSNYVLVEFGSGSCPRAGSVENYYDNSAWHNWGSSNVALYFYLYGNYVSTGMPPVFMVNICGSSDENGSEPEEMAILRKYGVETTINFSLYELDGSDLKTDAADGGSDCIIMKDEGPENTCTNDFADEGNGYSLVLSATEMQAARIVVYVIDQSNPKVWFDRVINIETYGNASAQHPFDLATATQDVNLAQIGGVAQSATDLKDFADTGYDPATHKVAEVTLVDTTTTNTDMVSQANITDILADTNELQTDWHDGGRLDLLIDAIKAKTDNLPADPADESLIIAAIAALNDISVADILAGAVDGAVTVSEALAVMLAALSGKTSGGGTNTLKARDVGDSKDRITLTVDADGNRTASAIDGS
jgi:hypothetical protein